jgi:hypothetical protein
MVVEVSSLRASPPAGRAVLPPPPPPRKTFEMRSSCDLSLPAAARAEWSAKEPPIFGWGT